MSQKSKYITTFFADPIWWLKLWCHSLKMRASYWFILSVIELARGCAAGHNFIMRWANRLIAARRARIRDWAYRTWRLTPEEAIRLDKLHEKEQSPPL